MSPFLSPIIVSSDIKTISTNTVLQIDPTQLLNPNRTAMLVDQFRFQFNAVNDVGSALAALYQMAVSIQLGSIALTNGLTPLAAVCPSYDSPWAGNIGAGGPMLQYVWHLPKPLYVPPNVVTYVNAARTVLANDTRNDTTNMRVAVVGRSLPTGYPIPAEIYVPWGTSSSVLDTTNVTTLGGVSTFVTPDNALGNPNDTALMMTRLLGFHASLGDSGVSETDVETGPNGLGVTMTVSSGKILVRNQTPFFHLFPIQRRYVDMRGILRGSNEVRGGEFVKARLDYTPNSINDSSNALPITILGLVGYRKVPTPIGANG